MVDAQVGIVLLNYNSYTDTSECINSIFQSNYSRYKIIVVDNMSLDNSLDKLRNEFSGRVIFIDNEVNEGFAAGCNVGIDVCRTYGLKYTLLLNNDTIIDKRCIGELVRQAEKVKNLGALGGKIYLHNQPNIIWDFGGKLDYLRGVGRRYGHFKEDTEVHNQVRRVDFVTGCMMLVPTEIFEKTKGLPDCYFFGIEEWDFGVILKHMGLGLYVTPKAILWHKVGGSHDDYNPVYYYNYLRGRFLFMRRNVQRYKYMFWFLIWSLYLVLIKPIRYMKLYMDNRGLLRATIMSIKDHLINDRITRLQFVLAKEKLYQ